MLTGKGRRRKRAEPVIRQNITQLDERIVKRAVAEGHHRHSCCAIALYSRQIFQQYVRHAPGIGRRPEHHHVLRPELRRALPRRGQREVIFFERKPQSARHFARNRGHNRPGRSGCAPVHRPNLFRLHAVSLLAFI